MQPNILLSRTPTIVLCRDNHRISEMAYLQKQS
jgi:hypothetical protein